MLTPIQLAVLVTLIAALLSVGYLLNVLPREERKEPETERGERKERGDQAATTYSRG